VNSLIKNIPLKMEGRSWIPRLLGVRGLREGGRAGSIGANVACGLGRIRWIEVRPPRGGPRRDCLLRAQS
jgi:hypothetical protein